MKRPFGFVNRILFFYFIFLFLGLLFIVVFMKWVRFLLFILFLFPRINAAFGENVINELKEKLKVNNDSLKLNAYQDLVTEFVTAGDYKNAKDFAFQSFELFRKKGNRFAEGEASIMVGTVSFYEGNFPEALKYYLNALRNFEILGNKPGLSKSFVNLGVIYNVMNELKKSEDYFNKALVINKEIKNKNGLGYCYINLGVVYEGQGRLNEAVEAELSAIEIYEELGKKKEILDAKLSLALLYSKLGKNDEAIALNEDIIQQSKDIGYVNATMGAFGNLGEVYFKVNRIPESISATLNAIAIAKETGNIRFSSELYKGLHSTYEKIGKEKEALECYKNYIFYRDSLYNEENTKKLVAAQMQYEFDKKEASILAQQAIRNAVSEKEIEKQKYIILAVVLGAAFLILLLVLIIARRKAKHNLEVNKLENKTLRAQLNPHFIFNALASIQNYMRSKPDLAENYLAKFSKLMREVLENSEKESISLEEEINMLKKYMDLEALRVPNGFEYHFEVDSSLDIEDLRVPSFLLQPLVENAIWHGVAKSESKGVINIRLTGSNGYLNIEVENSMGNHSQGSFSDGKSKSFGLQIVRERLALFSREKGKTGNFSLFPEGNFMKAVLSIPV